MSLKEKITKVMPWNWGKEPVEAGTRSSPSLPALRRDFDSLFEMMEQDFLRPWGEPGFAESLRGGHWPRMDVDESEEEIQVTAEVPGVDERELNVSVDEDVLTIRGNRHESREAGEGGWRRRETWSGSFYRSIRLPAPVDADRAEAACRRGELRIRLPKKQPGETEARRIAVRAGE